jgi:hypothetical protein
LLHFSLGQVVHISIPWKLKLASGDTGHFNIDRGWSALLFDIGR